MARNWLILSFWLLTTCGCSTSGCSSAKSDDPTNVVGFHLPCHAVRLIRKGQYYDASRSEIEARLQRALGSGLVWSDGGITQYESRQGKFLLQLVGSRSGIEQASLRLHRKDSLTDKQLEARKREITVIAQVLMLGEDGTKWVCEAACGSVPAAIKSATEVHDVGKTTYALKAFQHADAEIDNEPSNPRLWITMGPHIGFEAPETVTR